MTKKTQALHLYQQGLSMRRIARLLGVSRGTVKKWLYGEQLQLEKKRKSLPPELREKLKLLLEHHTREKGKTKVLSFRQIFNALSVELKELGINSYHTFLRRLKSFIKDEYGSLYKLEVIRRDKKELHQYRPSRGRIERRKGFFEVDATGYTHNGRLYSVLLAQDEESGFVLGYMVVENREKDTKHYNKAFNELDYMYFLWNIFSSYGAPVGVKSDNERFLMARNVKRALTELGVQIQRTKPYSPNQKLIERTIRDIKEKIRLISAVKQSQSSNSFEEILHEAIELYNREEHSFVIGRWVPAERFQGYAPVDSDRLRIALSVEEERSVVNGYIRFENKTYEFRLPEDTELDLGRNRKAPQVKVRIDLENNTKAYVYDLNGQFLGVAVLVSSTTETSTVLEKQEKQTAKRVERRKKKLKEELYELEKPVVEKKRDFDLLLQIQETPQAQVENKKEEFDILDILSGGET